MENMYQPEDKWLIDGELRLHYLDWGNPEAVPMLLVHGHTGSARYWDFFARNMRNEYHVLAIDMRGHGDSSWTGNYNPEEYVADLEKFVDKLGLNDVIFIGHSMGGINGTIYAATHPEKVSRLIIVDIGPEVAVSGTEEMSRLRDALPNVFSSEEEAIMKLSQLRPYQSEEFLRHLVKYTMKRDKNGGLIFKYDPDLNLTKFTTLEWLWEYHKRVICPTLVVRGVESYLLLHEAACKMVEVLPFGTMVEIERASHSVPGDNPEAFEAAVVNFLHG